MPRRAREADAMPRVGAVLRELRENAGLSVAQAAAICGVHRKTWYRREHLGIVPPAPELDAFARSVDRRCPMRVKVQVLLAAGILTAQEAEATLTAWLELIPEVGEAVDAGLLKDPDPELLQLVDAVPEANGCESKAHRESRASDGAPRGLREGQVRAHAHRPRGGGISVRRTRHLLRTTVAAACKCRTGRTLKPLEAKRRLAAAEDPAVVDVLIGWNLLGDPTLGLAEPEIVPVPAEIFADGFEGGDASVWSAAPGAR